MQGYVQKISSKNGMGKNGPWVLYSVQVDGNWYGAGFNPPPCREGDLIEYDTIQKGQYTNIENIRLGTASAPAPVATPVAAAQAPPKNTTQLSIHLQSSRNAAINCLDVLLKSEAVKLPAKQADKYDAAMALLDEITARFFVQLEQDIEAGGISTEEVIPQPSVAA